MTTTQFEKMNKTERWLLAVNAALSAAIVVVFFYFVPNGLDTTDAAFNILNAKYPHLDPANVSSYELYTSFLLQISQFNVLIFRFIATSLFFIVSLIFIYQVAEYFLGNLASDHRVLLFSSLLPAAASGLVAFYRIRSLSPSYNWLDMIGIMLTAISLIKAATCCRDQQDNTSLGKSVVSQLAICAVMVGLGGVLSYLAKPTSAALLAVSAVIWILASDLRHRIILFSSIAFVSAVIFLTGHVFLFEGGPASYIAKLQEGLVYAQVLGGGNEVGTIFENLYQDLVYILRKSVNKLRITSITAVLIVLSFFVFRRFSFRKYFAYSFAAVSILAFAEFILRFGVDQNTTGFELFSLAAVIGLFVLLSFGKFLILREIRIEALDLRFLLMAAFLVMLSISYTFGTNTGAVDKMIEAFLMFGICFIVCAEYARVRFAQIGSTAAAGLVVSLFGCLILYDTVHQPHRLQFPLTEQTVPVSFFGLNGGLKVDRLTASYVNGLQKAAADNGWKPGMFLVDLTGRSPGASVFLGAEFLTKPWLFGGYPGSSDFAVKALSEAPRPDLEAAWILTAPKGRIQIPTDALARLDLDFPSGYQQVGGFLSNSGEFQLLWRPAHHRETPK
ncbi:hypothetical protein [Roseibium album]|uniref:hypothetical protein n=1 Tax=Roseibium album TaxID=311410 RepID=UPI003BB1383F